MKLDTVIEGYQRLCECKNGSFITTDFRVISIPKYCIFKLSKANTLKNIRRFYGKISGNQLPVNFPLFLQAPVNIFRNQAQNGRKGHYCLFVIQLYKTTKGIFEHRLHMTKTNKTDSLSSYFHQPRPDKIDALHKMHY